jgi:hypothetical protein
MKRVYLVLLGASLLLLSGCDKKPAEQSNKPAEGAKQDAAVTAPAAVEPAKEAAKIETQPKAPAAEVPKKTETKKVAEQPVKAQSKVERNVQKSVPQQDVSTQKKEQGQTDVKKKPNKSKYPEFDKLMPEIISQLTLLKQLREGTATGSKSPLQVLAELKNSLLSAARIASDCGDAAKQFTKSAGFFQNAREAQGYEPFDDAVLKGMQSFKSGSDAIGACLEK